MTANRFAVKVFPVMAVAAAALHPIWVIRPQIFCRLGNAVQQQHLNQMISPPPSPARIKPKKKDYYP